MSEEAAATTKVHEDRGPMGERRTVIATIADVTANPGPLGLMAFGMTTVLLNIHNAGSTISTA
jgi:succinate-acetate transporter protein